MVSAAPRSNSRGIASGDSVVSEIKKSRPIQSLTLFKKHSDRGKIKYIKGQVPRD